MFYSVLIINSFELFNNKKNKIIILACKKFNEFNEKTTPMATKKSLKIGRSDFGLIVKDGYYFVDKTMLIYDFHNNANDILLIPRPKRFGKTLNLSMIEHFFDIQKPESRELFSEFKISKHKDFCEKHQNKYPVINISLKSIKEANWEACLNKFKIEIFNLYNKHIYLLQSDKINAVEKENFEQVLKGTATQARFEYSL